MTKFFLFISFITLALTGYSADTVRVSTFKASQTLPLFSPLIIDSVDVEKKKFDEKMLLKSTVDFASVTDDNIVLKADSEGLIDLSGYQPSKTDTARKYALQVLSFSIDPDRYCKANLTVTATEMLEIYVNGKKEKSKETREDSLAKSKPITVELTLEPRRYEVAIKRLADGKPDTESLLKAEICPRKNDSLAVIAVSTGEKRRIYITDMVEGNRLSGVASISPSGKYYITGQTNTFEGGKNVSSVELRELSSNRLLMPLDMSPRWAKGKDQLIYTRTGSGGRNLYRMDIPQMTETLIAQNIPSDGRITDDGRFLIYSKREEIPADKGDIRRTLSPSDRSGAYRGRSSLWLYDFNTGLAQRITYGHTSMSLNDVSSDSRKALIMRHEENITERPFVKNTLFELDLQTLSLDSLLSDPFMSSAIYSPDGKELLISGSGEAFGGAGQNVREGQIPNPYNNIAFIADRKTLNIRPITKNFNPAINAAAWSSFDNLIYFSVEDKDRTAVYSYNHRTEQFKKLPLPEDIIRNFKLAELAPVAVFQGEGTNNSWRMYSYNLKTGKSVLLNDPYSERLGEMQLSPVIDRNFTSTDGALIEGRYYLPPDFDQSKKYPMIVYYYGGTSPTSRNFESNYPLQVYAALGYVVYAIQPSGTTGYGQEFAARHVNAWGKQTADDIIVGTQKFFREHNFVDSTKVGCIGASYGGFMTQYLQTQTRIFAAAVSHAGISDITSYWGEGYWGYSYSSGASAGSYPWNNPRMYVEQSPLFNADKINTPLLLLHGSADTNVPPGESIQMFNALRILGKTVELITVDGENHHIIALEKKLLWNKTIYAWFARWLKDQPEWWQALYPDRL